MMTDYLLSGVCIAANSRALDRMNQLRKTCRARSMRKKNNQIVRITPGSNSARACRPPLVIHVFFIHQAGFHQCKTERSPNSKPRRLGPHCITDDKTSELKECKEDFPKSGKKYDSSVSHGSLVAAPTTTSVGLPLSTETDPERMILAACLKMNSLVSRMDDCPRASKA